MMMKLRRENRRTFDLHLKPNIFEVPTTALTPDDFPETMNASKTDKEQLEEFLTKFNKGKELGSLIDFSTDIFKNALINEIIHKQFTGQLTFDTSNQLAHRHELKSLVRRMGLSSQYTISVTNPLIWVPARCQNLFQILSEKIIRQVSLIYLQSS